MPRMLYLKYYDHSGELRRKVWFEYRDFKKEEHRVKRSVAKLIRVYCHGPICEQFKKDQPYLGKLPIFIWSDGSRSNIGLNSRVYVD